jgi:hypothetical protein
LPSQLARQRPDVRAAEAVLARAGAQVGVATASLYPQITLSAQVGTLTTDAGDVFSGGTGFYYLGASLVQPLFHGGELRARRRSAVAAYEQAGASYQETVLLALQNVADVLRALEADANRFEELADAAERAKGLRDITAERLKAGGVSEAAIAGGGPAIPSRADGTDAGRRRSLRGLRRAAAGPRRRLVARGLTGAGEAARNPRVSCPDLGWLRQGDHGPFAAGEPAEGATLS